VIKEPKLKQEPEEILPKAVILKNWRLIYPLRLTGSVYGHPNFPDGEPVITSPIVWMAGGRAQTQNTLYILEDPA